MNGTDSTEECRMKGNHAIYGIRWSNFLFEKGKKSLYLYLDLKRFTTEKGSEMSDLWSLARNNDVSGLKNLFEKGIGIKAVDENGSSLLHHAAETNSTDVIIYLVERGADIETKDKHGFTVSGTTSV